MEKFIPNTIRIDSIKAPASKSYAQRALMAAMLSNNPISLKNIGESEDVKYMLQVIQDFGANVLFTEEGVEIISNQNPAKNEINCGESGLGSRLTISVACLFDQTITIHGQGSLLSRPMKDFEAIFTQMEIDHSSNNGFLPIEIKGGLKACEIEIDGSLSSQYLSGLLMALPLAKGDSTIKVKDLKSRPYVDMTIQLLNDFGIEIENDNYHNFRIKGNQVYISPINYIVEGDWSGAAFWIVYGAIHKGIKIEGLNPNSLQADREIIKVLDSIEVPYNWEEKQLSISPSSIQPFEFDANDCPDLFPALLVLAASANGISSIKGLKRLKHKESDRGLVLQREFLKLGLKIELLDDEMRIHGKGSLKSGEIDSNNDHRIAMAGAIASLLTDNGVTILEAACVNKSYPEFWDVL